MARSTTFLLVDDDSDDTALFKEVLYAVDPFIVFQNAENGEEALYQLRLENAALPDIIFLDLNMPRMDGKQCLVELKSDDKLKRIPVFIYTTSSQSKDIEQAIQRGAICFLTKPTNIRELKNILSSIAENIHGNLEEAMKTLSRTSDTFIVC